MPLILSSLHTPTNHQLHTKSTVLAVAAARRNRALRTYFPLEGAQIEVEISLG